MKIRKLIVTGFGPYALKQELDFENNLQDKNMFVITGNTGAGKTTIFDAINFALYGNASGTDREAKSLRSDFADPKTPTEVELWFSVRSKEYYVKRAPSYTRPNKKGEGVVESKPSAEIRLPKDKTITGITQVTKEVEDILGITTEQFKQLVMIPQGEFKRLLNAKSDEKEDIFRKIFGTQIFQNIQNQLKQKANNLEKGIRDVKRDRGNAIRRFNCKEKDDDLFRLINAEELNIDLIMDKFYKFIEEDKKEENKLREKIEEKSIFIERITKEITVGNENNKKFEKLEKNKKIYDKLRQQVEEFESKKLQAEWGKKALTVKGYEDKYKEKNIKFKELSSELEAIEKKIKIYNERYLNAEEEFNKQKGREEEKNKLNNEINENEKLKEKVSEYEVNNCKVKTLEEKVEKIKYRINEIGLNINENNKKLKSINNDLEDVNKAKEEKGKLEIELIEFNYKKGKLDKLLGDIEFWINKNDKHTEVSLNYTKIEKRYNEARREYELLEDAFRKNQAGILASKLDDGTPCPVCGSIHHPKIAILEDGEITEDAVKTSKEILDQVKEENDKVLLQLTKINTSLSEIKNNSIDPAIKELLGKDVVYDVIEIKTEVNELFAKNNNISLELFNKIQNLSNKINKENEIIKYQNNLKENNEKLSKELELKNEERAQEEGELSAAKKALEIIKNDFKGDIKTIIALNEIIKTLNEKLLALNNAYRESEKAFNTIKGNLDQELGKKKTTNEMKERAYEELQEAIELFRDNTVAFGFVDGNDYKAKRLTEEEIEQINKQINDFYNELAGAKISYDDSLKEVENLSIVDLEVLKEKLANEKSKEKDLNDEKLSVFSRIENNDSILEDCEKYNKAIESNEKKYETIGRLSKVVNGDNSKKISFERYVLASYFEDIIVAANIRLIKMTSGRFELLRKQETGDMRKGQGLELEVFDNYTGKARDIKTLSGGESFKASLSMALGLADVVQAYSGGIQLDTMFIDEGFGTLDPESLDNAIECLMDLQKDGRLVGIISHVPELKERIDARLEVTTTNKGSMAKFKL